MTIVLLMLAAFGASLLTFFSGFGLGTILMPVMAIFFPIEVAVALTGIVHLLNNIFKLILVGKYTQWGVVLRFGLPAILAAFVGARLLFVLPHIKLIVAPLMIIFALFEVLPRFKTIQFGMKWMPAGGLLSGFFGGLSGHQGALRSMFLIRTGLTKEAFIATGVMIACVIDVTRLGVYSTRLGQSDIWAHWPLLLAATLSAFAGAFLGSRLLKKVTIDAMQLIVGCMIIVLALLLMLGVV